MKLCKITGHFWKYNYELIKKDDPILTEVRICSFCKRKDIIVEPTLADKRDMKLRQLGIK
jgi:hypothetical protein